MKYFANEKAEFKRRIEWHNSDPKEEIQKAMRLSFIGADGKEKQLNTLQSISPDLEVTNQLKLRE